MQLVRQASAASSSLSSPLSQPSPAAALTTPSPHEASVQLPLQAAVSPPVSHSSPSSSTPSPQETRVQSLRQVAPPLPLPSSQTSVPSISPLPQTWLIG